MKPSELETAIREKLNDDSVVIRDMTDNGGWGLVRYERLMVVVGGPEPVREPEYIVHRWAVKDTAGNDIPFMLYSGAYFEDDFRRPGNPTGEELARQEYIRRWDGRAPSFPPTEYSPRES